MLRSTASKVMWVGRTTATLFGLALVMALLFGVATTALAGTGVGAAFNLGKVNSVNQISKLIGSTASSMLMVDNNGPGPALDLKVGSPTTPAADKTTPPMVVDSQAEVANLNAQFAGQADNAAHADTADSATNATNAENATNATNAENATNAQNAAGLECTGCVSANDLGSDAATQPELDSEANTRANADNALSTELAGKANTNHSHDDRYYTETEVYTKTQVDTALSGKASTTHLHDDRYFTETEVNTALSGKANTTHQHSGADITSGKVADAQIADTVARDSEVVRGPGATYSTTISASVDQGGWLSVPKVGDFALWCYSAGGELFLASGSGFSGSWVLIDDGGATPSTRFVQVEPTGWEIARFPFANPDRVIFDFYNPRMTLVVDYMQMGDTKDCHYTARAQVFE